MTKITLALLIVYAPLLIFVVLFQDKLLFFPDSRPFNNCGWIEQKGAKIIWDKNNTDITPLFDDHQTWIYEINNKDRL